MTQLRQNSDKFLNLNVAVIIVGPEKAESFAAYWRKAGLDAVELPFVGIPDPEEQILELYAQPKRLLRLGRMPMQVLIDSAGIVRWKYIGSSMSDIPAVDKVLEECRNLHKQG